MTSGGRAPRQLLGSGGFCDTNGRLAREVGSLAAPNVIARGGAVADALKATDTALHLAANQLNGEHRHFRTGMWLDEPETR